MNKLTHFLLHAGLISLLNSCGLLNRDKENLTIPPPPPPPPPAPKRIKQPVKKITVKKKEPVPVVISNPLAEFHTPDDDTDLPTEAQLADGYTTSPSNSPSGNRPSATVTPDIQAELDPR